MVWVESRQQQSKLTQRCLFAAEMLDRLVRYLSRAQRPCEFALLRSEIGEIELELALLSVEQQKSGRVSHQPLASDDE